MRHALGAVGILVPMLLATGPAWAQMGADSPPGTLITDPAKLASFGYPPDATVYLADPTEAKADPPNYGASNPIMYVHSGLSFVGRDSTFAYTIGDGVGGLAWAGGDRFADAQLHLPSGAVWENTRAWVSLPTAGTDFTITLHRSCLPANGPGVPTSTILSGGSVFDSIGEHSVEVTLPAGTVIDNNACLYWVRASFTRVGVILRKVRTQYRLQVSPSPAAATFPNDVPTTHPLFRFVEALAASGVSGGCAPGSFCPDAPITRGQMAVFLSVALGLHFPN